MKFFHRKNKNADTGYELYLDQKIDDGSIQKVYFFKRGSVLDHMAIKFLNDKLKNPTVFWDALTSALDDCKEGLPPGNWQIREINVNKKLHRILLPLRKEDEEPTK